MTDTAAPSATYDTKSEGAESQAALVKMWLDALKLAEAEEKDWLKKAEDTAETYRGKKGNRQRVFNILHSNVETLCPALYNSTPSPDVRRRFADPDPVAKAVADVLERALAFSIDNYDFDATIKTVVRNGEIVGRGIPRITYEPTFGEPLVGPDGQPQLGPDGQPVRELAYQAVTCEVVPWRYFRHGPGRCWSDVQWVAFGMFLTREQLAQINPGLADKIPMNYSAGSKGKSAGAGKEPASIFRRCLAWQIWDREARQVITITEDYADAPLAVSDDPLGLSGFFPVPRPYQPVFMPEDLTPVVPYELYEDLVDELNDITQRIARLVRQLRPRGGYGGSAAADFKNMAEADDGELIPLTGVEFLGQNGGLEKWVVWFPLEPVVKALQQLVQQRELVKAVIYEVTGLSDILRGAQDASETATASQIKTQWGSLRIQDRQAEVARLVRDLFRLKAEVISGKFSMDQLMQMTGIKLPAQADKDAAQAQIAQMQQQAAAMPQQQNALTAPGQPGPAAAPQAPQQPQAPQIPPELQKILSTPSREEVEQLLRSDINRLYRIDVESDSTIRGDLTRNQQTMSMFLQGTAQFVSAMGPIIQQAPSAMKPAMEVYAAFARQFRLGKQAEDALDSLSDSIKDVGAPQHKEDPKLEATKISAQAEIQRAGMGMEQAKTEHAMSMQQMAAEQQNEQTRLEMDRQRMQMDAQRDAIKHHMSMQQGMMAQQLPPGVPPQ